MYMYLNPRRFCTANMHYIYWGTLIGLPPSAVHGIDAVAKALLVLLMGKNIRNRLNRAYTIAFLSELWSKVNDSSKTRPR